MLTATELESMRTAAVDLMPDRADVRRLTSVPDGRGGRTQTYVTAHSQLAARLAPGSSRADAETIIDGRPMVQGAWMVTLPYGSTVQMTDRIIINGLTLEVTSTDYYRSELTCVRVVCKEVQ
jgi:hypothetical protein